MTVTLSMPRLTGSLPAIPSKSEAHRLLIAAALSDRETTVVCPESSRDIDATAAVLSSLGATVTRTAQGFSVTPIRKVHTNAVCNADESGSTLRFMIPVSAALSADADFVCRGRLKDRPLSPMREELASKGVGLSAQGENPIRVRGRLTGGEFSLRADVSSQFVTGLLIALPLLDTPSRLTLVGRIESSPYIDITLDTLRRFSVAYTVSEDRRVFDFLPRETPYTSPVTAVAGGDWSNAAFFLAAGALSEKPITVTGLCRDTKQGDRAILDILRAFGADVTETEDRVTVVRRRLHGIRISAEEFPDLVPVIAVVASVAEGTTVIGGASRLRLKESDRLKTVTEMLSALGGEITEAEDGLLIRGVPMLSGGSVSAANDHRIAMSAAVAATVSKAPVSITGAEAVEKSYPAFFRDFDSICINR